MLVRVKRHAHGGDARNAVFGKYAVQFAASGLKPDHERFHSLAVAHFGRNSLKRTRQIVGNRKHVAGKAGCGIRARILRLFFHTAADILRFGLRVQHILLGSGNRFFQCRDFCIGSVGRFWRFVLHMLWYAFKFFFYRNIRSR